MELPWSATLAWWGTAWLRGHVVTDELLDALGPHHAVRGLPDGPGPRPLLDLLVAGRRAGADGVGLALPVEGDPVGLGGPRAFNDAALASGEGVVLVGTGYGAVPVDAGDLLEWWWQPAERRQLPDVGESDRALRVAFTDAATALAALDVARWRPEAADLLMNLRHPPEADAPEGTPRRCVELAARGLLARGVVAVALEDDGGAVSSYEMNARREALRPLDRCGLRAVVAACSPEVWPSR